MGWKYKKESVVYNSLALKIGWCIKKYAGVIKEGDSQSKMIYLRL